MALARIPLILLPTPMHRLERMSAELGIDLWIKRDDLTGLAMGGNKGRKLEYLMADVLASHADVVVTCGAGQSNFVRQLGAACAMLGVRCVAAVMDLPYDATPPLTIAADPSSLAYPPRPQRSPGEDSATPLRPPRETPLTGNLVLDDLLGIDLRFHDDGTWDELYVHAENLACECEAEGLRVHRIPVGGSSPLGAHAFYVAAQEIDQSFDAIVFASSSGSTHTGLAAAFAGTGTRILGMACDPEPDIAEDFAKLSTGLHDLVPSAPALQKQDFDLDFSFVGPGYGLPSAAGNAAIRLLARTEGIFLDPIYTAKAFAGLLDLATTAQLTGRVLFWHTGGLPALFAA